MGPTPTASPTPTATATASPTPTATATATPCQASYTTATTTGTITAGGTDIGNHCDDCNTSIVLPFPVNVYGAPVSVATVGSNGDLQLTASPSEKLFFVLDQCVPVNPDPASHGPFLNTLFPYYADLVTDESVGPCTGCGVFTQTLGTAPNRQFVIRWKANYFNSPPGPAQAEFEVLLTEGSDTLSVIYGVTGDNGLMATSGIQQDLNVFTSFSCNEATLTPGVRVNYIPTTLWQSDADSDVDTDGHGYGYSDRNGYGYCCRNSDCNGYGNSHSDCNCDCAAEVYANATAASDAAASTVGSVTS